MVGRRWGKNWSQELGFRIQVTSSRARGMLNYQLNCLPPTAYCLRRAAGPESGTCATFPYCLLRVVGPNKSCRWPRRGVK